MTYFVPSCSGPEQGCVLHALPNGQGDKKELKLALLCSPSLVSATELPSLPATGRALFYFICSEGALPARTE